MEDEQLTRAIFLDFRKAFDSVWHCGLLYKLKQKGVSDSMLKWFASYLSGRTVQTRINGIVSSRRRINRGVPQGSILGPLLFLVYIDDIVLNLKSTTRLFADDVLLHVSGDAVHQVTTTLNEDLESVHDWSILWQLHLNVKKCEPMTFSKYTVDTLHFPLIINGVSLSDVQTHKTLIIGILKEECWAKRL
jgi:reverse transcriptase-like protein